MNLISNKIFSSWCTTQAIIDATTDDYDEAEPSPIHVIVQPLHSPDNLQPGAVQKTKLTKFPSSWLYSFLGTLLPGDCVMDRLSFSAPEAWFVILIR